MLISFPAKDDTLLSDKWQGSLMLRDLKEQWWRQPHSLSGDPNGSKCYCRTFHYTLKIRWHQAGIWCEPMYFTHNIWIPSEKQRQNTQKCDQIPKIFSSTIQSKVPPPRAHPLGCALSVCPAVSCASFQLLIASYINMQNCHQSKSARAPWALHIPSFWIVIECLYRE